MTKELKARIRTLKSTHKITSAMKVVSATGFNRLKYHANHMFSFLSSLTKIKHYMTEAECVYPHPRLLIIVGGDRGLCGGYNNNIRRQASSYLVQFPESHVGYIGVKGALKGHPGIFKETVQRLKHWDILLEALAPMWDQYARIDVLYTQFHTLYDQQIKLKSVRPCNISAERNEPVLNEISANILPLIQTAQVMKAIVHAQLCEFSTRMLSMDNATQNADKMIHDLQLTCNKIRQAMITKELSETVAGSI